MHESALVADLVHTIEDIAQEQHAQKVVGVTLTLGAFSHISPEHLREHFRHVAAGTVAADARLQIAVLTDTTDPLAHAVLLKSVEVEEASPL